MKTPEEKWQETEKQWAEILKKWSTAIDSLTNEDTKEDKDVRRDRNISGSESE